MPLKIGFVLDDSLDKQDGVQQYVITLGRYFTSLGHDVHYLVGQTDPNSHTNVHSLSRTVSVAFNKNRVGTPLPASRRRIKALLEQEKFDVLHVQMPYSPLLAARVMMAADKHTAVVGTFHIIPFSSFEKRATRLLGMLLKRSRQRFDEVISVSAPAAAFLAETFKLPSVVIPNAVAHAQFKAGKRLPQADNSKLTIVFLGRLVARKGCMYLLQALAQLQATGALRDVRVLICGKGPLGAELKTFAAEHDLQDVVTFVGFLSEAEKPDYLASADIAVFPSTGGESFGIVLIEAMAAGAGVVLGGDNPGYRSVLSERPSQLIPLGNVDAFANQLKGFIISKQARLDAHAWQAKAVKQYDVAVVGDALIDVYQGALLKRSANLR